MATTAVTIRPTVEADRGWFVERFQDPEFMRFSDGVLDAEAAEARFDHMVAFNARVPFGKQPVVEVATGRILGYVGVDETMFAGQQRFEFGYRLDPSVSGAGVGSTAGQLALDAARAHWSGELLAYIDPTNEPSQRLAAKLGFRFWKLAPVNGSDEGIWTLTI